MKQTSQEVRHTWKHTSLSSSATLKLVVLLQSPESCATSLSLIDVVFTGAQDWPRALHTPGKPSNHWAIPLILNLFYFIFNKRDQKVYSKASPWIHMGGGLRRGTRIQGFCLFGFFCFVFCFWSHYNWTKSGWDWFLMVTMNWRHLLDQLSLVLSWTILITVL